jgi:uncharacterized protein YbjT (DUF2867 family)
LIATTPSAGVPHLVHISIVGEDRVPLGCYRANRDVERLIENSGGLDDSAQHPVHQLVLGLVKAAAQPPIMIVPAGVHVQPIDAREVAARLAQLAAAGPAGAVADTGGPEVRSFRELAEVYLAATRRRRAALPVRLPGKIFAADPSGEHLAPRHAVGRTTFAEFLAETRSDSPAPPR